jgi:hypothetical protein
MGRIMRTQGERAEAVTARGAAPAPTDSVLALQRMAGNHAVAHLLRCKGKKGGTVSQAALKAAPNQSTVKFAHLPTAAQTALREILAGREGPYLRPNKGKHSTDPETGVKKGEGIGVREYHVTPSNESQRFVVRTVGKDKRAYWDGSHAYGTYTYLRSSSQRPPRPWSPRRRRPSRSRSPRPRPTCRRTGTTENRSGTLYRARA